VIPIYGVTFLDILGFTILIPLLPFVSKRFGAPDVVAGALIATTAVCATLSSPVWGSLSDRYGRKRVLLGSQLFSLGGYLLLAFAGGLPWLFLSRIIEGCGGGNLGVATSYISDVTTDQSRPRALAYGTAAFGAGFIVGPIVGGALAHFGFTVPFLFAAGMQALNFALTATLLPESRQKRRATFDWRELRAALARPGIGRILTQRFLYIFAFTYFFTTFSLFLNAVLRAGPAVSSALLGVAGAVGAATQVFAVGPLIDRVGLRIASLAALAAGMLAYALLGFVDSIALFTVVIVFWAFSGSVLRPAIDARIVQLAPEDERGTMLGLGDSLDNFALIVAPVIGAAIIGAAPRLIGVLPALVLGFAFALTLRDA
jgi:DHA1 family tetracycline resistance protein-like MFS transporter